MEISENYFKESDIDNNFNQIAMLRRTTIQVIVESCEPPKVV
jgi:hypothetical protein